MPRNGVKSQMSVTGLGAVLSPSQGQSRSGAKERDSSNVVEVTAAARCGERRRCWRERIAALTERRQVAQVERKTFAGGLIVRWEVGLIVAQRTHAQYAVDQFDNRGKGLRWHGSGQFKNTAALYSSTWKKGGFRWMRESPS
ncbi:hypothetical protein BC567DRAFT_249811 [Phyllosticta citribraziliensis]